MEKHDRIENGDHLLIKEKVALTHLNHLKAHYSTDRDSLFVEIGRPSKEMGTPLKEARHAARLIYEEALIQKQPLRLCMSGGIDSEAMARAFLLESIPFEVVILRFCKDLNHHDIVDAVNFCRENEIVYKYIDIDVFEFLEGGQFFDIARKYYCRSPQFTVHIELLRRVEGFPVFAWNPTSIQWVNYPGEAIRLALPGQLHLSYHRYFEMTGRTGVGFFFAYTPELFYSFFQTPTMNRMLHQQGDQRGLVTTYESKCLAYQEGGFEVVPRASKFTGFEKVKEAYATRFGGDPYMFDRLFRSPLEVLYPDPANHYSKLNGRYLQPLASVGVPKT